MKCNGFLLAVGVWFFCIWWRCYRYWTTDATIVWQYSMPLITKLFMARYSSMPISILQSILLIRNGHNQNPPPLINFSDVSLYCLRCKEYFPTQPEFTYHSCSNETINTGEFFCKKCKTKFDSRPELKYHDCPEDHYCVECDRYFDTPNDAMKHSCDEQEEDDWKKSMEGENLQVSLLGSFRFSTF